jgi:hypothetical protein
LSTTTTTKATSKAATLAQLQALVAGLQKQLPNGSFTLVSTVYTTAALVTALQGLIAALTGVDTAQAGAKAALVIWEAEDAKLGQIILALKRTLLSMYANAPDTLAVFGLKPRKAPGPRTAAQRAVTAAKAAATRAARGTTGSKQKLAVTGNVTGVTITPIVAPAPAATPPAQPVTAQPASPPVTAPPAAAQPATPAPSGSPTGHGGQ